jgi:hypothetical protein
MELSRPDEVPGFNMRQQVSHFVFAHLGLAPALTTDFGSAAALPDATRMVRFKVAPTSVPEGVDTPRHDKVFAMPPEVVIEKLSDEVTLPNFRPRNSP